MENQPKLNRRGFLGKAGKATAALVLGVSVASSIHDTNEAALVYQELLKPRSAEPIIKPALPEKLPDDTLTPEQLKAARIRIIQSPSVKLHLREGAFDVPVFRDAAEGKLDELVIVVSDKTNWNITKTWDDEARTMWRTHYEPKYRDMLTSTLVTPGLESQDAHNYLRDNIGKILEGTMRWEDLYALVQSEDDKLRLIYRQKVVDEILNNDRIPHIGHPGGEITATKWYLAGWLKNLLQLPDNKNKVFIYLYADEHGGLMPHPDQSFLHPNQLTARNDGSEYLVAGITAGFALKHEAEHYDPASNKPRPERITDARAFFQTRDAWNHYSQTGSTRKFWAVFVTDEGITIT